MRFALVSDFDGTITDTDFFTLIAERHMPPGAPDYFELWRRGAMTHVEAMQAFFRWSPTDAPTLEAMLREIAPDPELKDACDRLAAAGWQLIIVSAGSTWYIERALAAAGVNDVIVHSNPGTIVPGEGLQLELPRSSPFFSPQVGIDKPAVVRDALSRYEQVAFAGDGPPDLAPALLVPARMRFARRWLANELTRRAELFHPFTRWSAIVDQLI